MTGIVLALLAATGWGISAVLARAGLVHIRTLEGTLISLISGFSVVLAVTLLMDMQSLTALSLAAIAWFTMIGVLNFPMGRLLNFMAVSRIGVSKSSPILATSPLLSMLLAVLLAGETITLPILAGSLIIMAGIYLVVSG